MYKFGVYNFNNNLDYHIQKSKNVFDNSTDVKLTGSKNLNSFYSINSIEVKKDLNNYLNDTLDTKLDWNFEYFKSGEPAGLHTDYDITPWDNRTSCRIDVGVIIPLFWNCKQPYTLMYNRIADTPRKLIYRKGEMRYKDTNEIISYRDKWEFDNQVLEFNPKNTQYYNEYADLKLDSVYEWKISTMLVFDTRRWHSSSWFLSTNELPEKVSEYKCSIIGFGSVDVPCN